MLETNDTALEYYAVVDEAIGPGQSDVKILSHVDNKNGLNFLRFSACLQSFGKRNRNKRLWMSKWVKQMLQERHCMELLEKGTFVGENGHPVPAVGDVNPQRIVNIDPNNISHRFTKFEWRANDNLLYAVVETLDDGPGSPGYKFMRHILQGLDPSFSLRSIVPQRRNPDGTIDVVGSGRLITYDRVILPSHEEAYINHDVPITNVHTLPELNSAMESFVIDLMDHSEKVKQILDKLSPVMESASIDAKSATVSVKVQNGDRLIIAPEMKYRKEIQDLFLN